MTNRILSAGEIILSDPDEAADPASPATILLIDDHPMLRNGVRQLISMEPSLTVAGVKPGMAATALRWRNHSIRI